MSEEIAKEELSAEEKKRAKEQLADMKAQQLAFEVIDENEDLFYITTLDRYAFTSNGNWKFVTGAALRIDIPKLRGGKVWEHFQSLLKSAGRVKHGLTTTFNKGSEGDDLNLIRTDNWLKPVPGQLHEMFELLLNAISGDDPAARTHVMQLVGWKYLHPEDFLLPALTWYGKGGAGKNLFVERVLARIFGEREYGGIIKVSFDEAKGFNASIAGKAVVFFDEKPDSGAGEILKRMIGSPKQTYNEKHIKKIVGDNTAWYILATNNPEGPIKLESKSISRRWSVIQTKNSLLELVSAKYELTEEEADTYIKDVAQHDVFYNDAECAIFLQHCIDAAQALGSCPKAYHGDDFDSLMEVQKDVCEVVFEEVFTDPNFKYISIDVLHGLYSTSTKRMNPEAGIMSEQRLIARCSGFLNDRRKDFPSVARTKKSPRIIVDGKTLRTVCFVNRSIIEVDPPRLQDNRAYYLTGQYLREKPQSEKMTELTAKIANL